MLEQGQSVSPFPAEEEEASKTLCGELATTSISCPPVPLWEQDVENSGARKNLRKKGGLRGRCFKI